MTSIGGGLRALIVGSGIVSGRVWRDSAPENPTYPHVTFIDPVSATPALRTRNNTSEMEWWERTIQVDAWQKRRDENDQFLAGLLDVLDGATVDANGQVLHLRVVQATRLVDPDLDIVRHSVTITTKHDRAAV